MLAAVVEFEKELWQDRRRIVRILSVDPGVITGICVLWIDADTGEIVGWAETLITHDETKQVWDLLGLLRVLADFGRVWIVIEDFRVQMVNMDEEFLSPVRVGRQFAFGAEIMRTGQLGDGPVFGSIEETVWQSNGRKADYDDARLKKLGFYTPGPDHRRDATRHALVRWKKLKTELPTGVETRADWWEPPLQKLETVKGFGRTFNGTAAGSHVGKVPPARVSKQDMERIARQSGRGAGKSSTMAERMVEAVENGELTMLATPANQEVSDVMKAAATTNGMRWVPMPNGAAGWVLEHDPATQSGIAPRRGPKEPEETTSETVSKVPQKRRRVMKKLV